MRARARLLAALLILTALLTGCGKKNPYEDIEQNPIATITLTDGSQMRFELYPQIAPLTVTNFIELANGGYYKNMEIFRVVSNVLIQSGDPNNNGTGGPDYYIKGEFEQNGFKNDISHTRGTISLARKSDYNTGGSQFFIMEGSYPEYDGYYAAFGRIVDDESLATLDAIGSKPVDGNYVPLDRIVIQNITVKTFDVAYKLDEKDKIDAEKEDKKK